MTTEELCQKDPDVQAGRDRAQIFDAVAKELTLK